MQQYDQNGQPIHFQPQPGMMYQQPQPQMQFVQQQPQQGWQQQQPPQQQQQAWQQPPPVQYVQQQPQFVQASNPEPQHAPTSPSAVGVAPLINSGAPSSSMEVASGDSSGEKQPKLCFCVEPTANLTEEQRQKKFRLHVPCSIISALASFVLLVLSIVALAKILNFSGAFTDIIETWQASPVYDVQFRNVGANGLVNCDAGFTFVGEQWGGTTDGCRCTGTNAKNSSDTRLCTTAQKTNLNCTDLPKYAPVQVSVASSLGLCIKRGGISALSRPSGGKDGSCPSGFIQCGTPPNNLFCTPANPGSGMTSNVCPLTDMAIAPDADISAFTRVSKTPLAPVAGSPPLFLFLARGGSIPNSVLPLASRSPKSQNVTMYPLTDIEVVSGRPCTISNSCFYSGRSSEYSAQEAAAKSVGLRGYNLVDGTSGCSGCTVHKVPGGSVSPDGLDIRYVRVFGRPERQAFNESGVPAVFTTSSSMYELSIQARSEVSWTSSCARTRKEIYGQRNNVSHVKGFQIVLVIVSILTFVIFSIAIPLAEYRTKGTWTNNRRNWYLQTGLNIGFKCFVVAFTLATMLVALGVLAYWTQIDGRTPSTQCADPLSTEIFRILSDDYKSLSYTNVGSIVSIGASGALDVVGKLLWACSK